MALLAVSGVPFFYWILHNQHLDWETPVDFLMYTGLGLCGAFGARAIGDLKLYGMDGSHGAHEDRSKPTDASFETKAISESADDAEVNRIVSHDQSKKDKPPKDNSGKQTKDAPLLRIWLLFSSLFAALLGSLAFVAVAALIKTAQTEQWGSGSIPHAVPAVEAVFGIPMLMWLPFFTVILVAGLVGHFFEDWMLELIARARARSILIAGGAFLFLFVALLSPGLGALALAE